MGRSRQLGSRAAALRAVSAGMAAGVLAVLVTFAVVRATYETGAPAKVADAPTPSARKTPAVAPSSPVRLRCEELVARGYTYPGVVGYWRAYGRPPELDADGNGIPCEEEYAPPVIDQFWQQ
ncbi:excalibur calcium-binding domain-containing protein [Kribbella sp. CA-253562]|uniref:excalibur calcium-binding domain-containing protein n=1 Tax=Kribbella sp. CA-253562 TaxID=3239942 RepID=UPI003D8AC7D1